MKVYLKLKGEKIFQIKLESILNLLALFEIVLSLIA